ncbi:MAG: acyltransferase family protein [Desulfobacterales bacterium]|nr:acyltransferase family protein [Desulfobacterales bacterium]MBF0396327.1 acyltransferase family protein [Desulfobacterales bacterium]
MLELFSQIKYYTEEFRKIFLIDSHGPDEVRRPDTEALELLKPFIEVLKKYFRAEVYGIENIPETKALIVGNHNAGITFMEPMFMSLEFYNKRPNDTLHFLAHDAMVNIPILKNLLIKTGAIRASHETAHKAFDMGHKVVVFPGGNYEAFRTFKDRYKVDFGGKKGFIKLALKAGVPIVPVGNAGGHETFFVLSPGHKLAQITGTKKFLRSESFPIFLGLPWIIGLGPIFHLPLPAKLQVKVGKPIYLDNYKPLDAENPKVLQEIYDKVISEVQRLCDDINSKRMLPVIG